MRKETVEITVGEDHGEFGLGSPAMQAHVEGEVERHLNAQPYIWEAQGGDPVLPVQLSLPFGEPR